jgi:hypothetical protein
MVSGVGVWSNYYGFCFFNSCNLFNLFFSSFYYWSYWGGKVMVRISVSVGVWTMVSSGISAISCISAISGISSMVVVIIGISFGIGFRLG